MTVTIKERTTPKRLVLFDHIKPGQYFVYAEEHSARRLQLRTQEGAVILDGGVYDKSDVYSQRALFEIIHDVDIFWG